MNLLVSSQYHHHSVEDLKDLQDLQDLQDLDDLNALNLNNNHLLTRCTRSPPKSLWICSNNSNEAADEAAHFHHPEEIDLCNQLPIDLSQLSSRLPAHYGVGQQSTADLATATSSNFGESEKFGLSNDLEHNPMRHSPGYLVGHNNHQPTSSLSFKDSIFTRSSSRPVFTRSQSVPETYLLDSADEELLLEAAAATLDDPLPITPSVVIHSQESLLRNSSSRPYHTSSTAPRYYRPHRPGSRTNYYQPIQSDFATSRRILSRLSLSSSELPTNRHSAQAQDRFSLLQAELQAAAAASRRLTSNNRVLSSTSTRLIPYHKNPTSLSSSTLTLGRSLQLVTEQSKQAAAAREIQHLEALKKLNQSQEKFRNPKFNSQEWRLQHQDLFHDLSLFPSGGLGIEEDAWMSVEDVQSGRWARWDALVKQESQDSQTRDSGIETGSCFTSSEDSNRGSTSNDYHLHHSHHYFHKKVA